MNYLGNLNEKILMKGVFITKSCKKYHAYLDGSIDEGSYCIFMLYWLWILVNS